MPDAVQPAPAPAVPPAAPAAPQAQTAPAPVAPAGTPQQGNPFGSFLILIPLFVIMYFLMIRPQRKQEKERKAMLDALKKNDQVLTIGGIYGTVAAVSDDQVTLKIDDGKDIRIRIARGAVQNVVKQSKGAEATEEKAGG